MVATRSGTSAAGINVPSVHGTQKANKSYTKT